MNVGTLTLWLKQFTCNVHIYSILKVLWLSNVNVSDYIVPIKQREYFMSFSTIMYDAVSNIYCAYK